MEHSKFDPFIKRTNVRNIKIIFSILNKIFILGQWIYPKAVADFVRKKFFRPVTKPLTKQQEAWINKAVSYKIKSRDKIISAWKIGEGPAILFVHGWNGRGVQFQRFFQPSLDAGYSVIFFDAPAHGISEGDMTNYLEITELLEQIFIQDLGKNIVGVIAHSLGTSAIINHMSRYHSEIPLVLVAAALHLMELLFANFQMHGVPKKTYLKLVREVEEQFQIPLETQNPIDLIYKIDNDILVIHDKNDQTTPIAPAIQVADDLGNVELIMTEGYGHSLLLKKEDVIERALSFVKIKDPIAQTEMELNSTTI
jgi:pimeloyl-ACP methyl ester carboxylesterase